MPNVILATERGAQKQRTNLYKSWGICPALTSVPLFDFLELLNLNITLAIVEEETDKCTGVLKNIYIFFSFQKAIIKKKCKLLY